MSNSNTSHFTTRIFSHSGPAITSERARVPLRIPRARLRCRRIQDRDDLKIKLDKSASRYPRRSRRGRPFYFKALARQRLSAHSDFNCRGLLDGNERVDAPPQLNPFAMAARETAEQKQVEML